MTVSTTSVVVGLSVPLILIWAVHAFHAVALSRWIWSLSKWLSDTLSAIVRRRTSPPRALNEDILLEIMQELAKPDVARAALVCRAWLPLARWTLYHDPCIDTNTKEAPLLCATMQSNAHLRILIRRLLISHHLYSKYSPLLLEWIELLPEHSLQLLRCRTLLLTGDQAAAVPILQFPAIRTLRHLFLPSTNITVAERLNQIVHFKHLETLSIVIADESATLSLPEPCLPKLKRLSVRLYDYGTTTSQILRHLSQPLERFDLKANAPQPHDLAALRQDLQQHLPWLKHASFIFNHPPEHPFVDELASSMSRIETLLCGDKTCTGELLSRLPPTFLSLDLYAPKHDPFQGELFARSMKQSCSPSMSKLTILDRRYNRQQNSTMPLAQACKACGVAFEIRDAEYVDYGTFEY